MMKIGDFASIFNVSIKTIRFYEKKGLLHPSYIDNYTGYRYFDEKNIDEMKKIVVLKNLGLELAEIKNIDKDSIDLKIKEYQSNIITIKNSINTLSFLSSQKGEVKDMEIFLNDEQAIGKWSLLGVFSEKEDYPNVPIDFDFPINELYLMPAGKKYWVISWSKNIVFINGNPNPYIIENGLMYLNVVDPFDKNEYVVAVFKKENSNLYTEEEIAIKDNIDVEYINDSDVIGLWETVDFIRNKEDFNLENKEYNDELYLKKLIFNVNNTVIVKFSDLLKETKYTKNHVINLCASDTLSNYELKEINGITYMVIEWKSGDYVFGKRVNGYYLLRKI